MDAPKFGDVGDGKFPYCQNDTKNAQDAADAENPNAAPDIRPLRAKDAPNDGREPTGPAAATARRPGRPRKAAQAAVSTSKEK